MTSKTVAIIGAGPVGLAAGAHALERGLTPVIFCYHIVLGIVSII